MGKNTLIVLDGVSGEAKGEMSIELDDLNYGQCCPLQAGNGST